MVHAGAKNVGRVEERGPPIDARKRSATDDNAVSLRCSIKGLAGLVPRPALHPERDMAETPEPEPKPKPQGWWPAIRKRLVLYGGLYLGVLLVLLWLENWFLYHPTRAADGWEAPPEDLRIQEATFPSDDGSTIHAWWTEPPGWTPAQGALLFSHGNAGNLSQRGWSVKVYRDQGHAVLIYDYPGYGKSTGKPSEKGIYAAGEAAYRWLTETKQIPDRTITLYGGSLGGAVATHLAARHPARVLVLVAAFTSFPDMAQRQFPIFPARWLVSNQMNNLGKMPSVQCPVFIAHGTADGLVPFSMAERLYAAAPEPKYLFPIPNGDHSDGVGADFFMRLRAFLAEHAKLGGMRDEG
jgi:pimeloyl-ACP methyl ester carboxylesterase